MKITFGDRAFYMWRIDKVILVVPDILKFGQLWPKINTEWFANTFFKHCAVVHNQHTIFHAPSFTEGHNRHDVLFFFFCCGWGEFTLNAN